MDLNRASGFRTGPDADETRERRFHACSIAAEPNCPLPVEKQAAAFVRGRLFGQFENFVV